MANESYYIPNKKKMALGEAVQKKFGNVLCRLITENMAKQNKDVRFLHKKLGRVKSVKADFYKIN